MSYSQSLIIVSVQSMYQPHPLFFFSQPVVMPVLSSLSVSVQSANVQVLPTSAPAAISTMQTCHFLSQYLFSQPMHQSHPHLHLLIQLYHFHRHLNLYQPHHHHLYRTATQLLSLVFQILKMSPSLIPLISGDITKVYRFLTLHTKKSSTGKGIY